MRKSSIDKLVQHLHQLYALPKIDNPLRQQTKQLKSYQSWVPPEKVAWRSNGIVHHEDAKTKRLPAKNLNNWEISRLNLSKRSYQHPKDGRVMKFCSGNKQFNKFDGRGNHGKIPYLYESDIHKLENIRMKLHSVPFRPTTKNPQQTFGFPQKFMQRSKSSLTTQIST